MAFTLSEADRLILAWMRDVRSIGDPDVVADPVKYTHPTDQLLRYGMRLEDNLKLATTDEGEE